MVVEEEEEIEYYGDEYIASKDAPVPRWLIYNYILWPLVGFVMFYLFWNGSYGWFDRGYWQELQRAANTTYPFNTSEIVQKAAQEDLEKRERAKVP